MASLTTKAGELTDGLADTYAYSEAMVAYLYRQPWFLAVGHAQWVLALICGAIWLWWPLGLAALWIGLTLARLLRGSPWDEPLLTDEFVALPAEHEQAHSPVTGGA